MVQRGIRGQDPLHYFESLGFGPGLVLADQFSVSMSGSGRSFTAYVVRRHQGVPREPQEHEDCAPVQGHLRAPVMSTTPVVRQASKRGRVFVQARGLPFKKIKKSRKKLPGRSPVKLGQNSPLPPGA